jgi:hypothetical protein
MPDLILDSWPGRIPCVLFLALASFFMPSALDAQVVYETRYRHEADAVLYKVLYPAQADIRVFKSEYQNQADPEKGIWHMTRHPSRADWKVYWTSYRNEADCTVYFTMYASQAKRNECFFQLKGKERNNQER